MFPFELRVALGILLTREGGAEESGGREGGREGGSVIGKSQALSFCHEGCFFHFWF